MSAQVSMVNAQVRVKVLVCGACGPCPRALWTGPVPGREFHPGLGRSVRAIRAWMCESAELCRPGPGEWYIPKGWWVGVKYSQQWSFLIYPAHKLLSDQI